MNATAPSGDGINLQHDNLAPRKGLGKCIPCRLVPLGVAEARANHRAVGDHNCRSVWCAAFLAAKTRGYELSPEAQVAFSEELANVCSRVIPFPPMSCLRLLYTDSLLLFPLLVACKIALDHLTETIANKPLSAETGV